ncbi:MAG TPA: thiamine pyrophosphate-binding protein [Polyangiaceae bacterium]|nr:thiamine pyrophosphate-binding protein [Polyangiaceae bacterium]
MPEIRGSDLVAEYLVREKVPYLFGYAGHGAVGLLDGIYDRSSALKIIFPRIETAAGYMADAFFRATGQVIPVYTSTGPGPMLLTAAISNAFYDSSSFIALTGQVATTQFDSGALQEEGRYFPADFPSVVKPIVKQSFQAHSVDDLAKFLPKAFKLARSGRPGPVHIDVPYDLWMRKADVEIPEPAERSRHLNWRTAGTPEAVERALDLLLKAKRPLILAGGGVVLSDATSELVALAEHLNVPVYTTYMGKTAISARHPLALGIAGCWGEYPATEAARNADVILAFGARFSDIHCSSWVPGYTYNIPPTKLIHVDLDEREIGRNYPTELGIVGDAREVMKQLLEMAKRKGGPRPRNAWNEQVEAYKSECRDFIEPNKASDAVPIEPRRVIGELRRAAPDETMMITDTGNHQCWVEQYWDTYEPRTMFTPGGFAGMGFGTYGVLGVKLGRPDRPAVCVTSDGSFMMFPGAVATAVEHDIPVTWVILNNYTIGVIRDLQRFYMDGREIATSFMKHATGELWNPDFAKMAESMGALGLTVDQPGDLGTAFRTALESGRPTVVDVRVNRDTAVPLVGTWQFPPITQVEPTFGRRLVIT